MLAHLQSTKNAVALLQGIGNVLYKNALLARKVEVERIRCRRSPRAHLACDHSSRKLVRSFSCMSDRACL